MSQPFTLRREDLLKHAACKYGIDMLDSVTAALGSGPDGVLPDGWTELHSVMLYQWNPQALIFLVRYGLVPNHNISRKIPFLYNRSMLPNE